MKRIILFLSCILVISSSIYAFLPEGLSVPLADGDLTSLTVSDDSENIIVTVEASVITSAYQIFIDIDDEENTGLIDGTWSVMGADYLIETGSIYKYNGINGAWGWVFVGSASTADVAISGGTEREISIPKKLIANPSITLGDQIYVGYKSVDGGVTDFIPDTPGMESHTLTTNTNLINMVVTSDATNLYVTVNGPVIETSYDIYINTDGNAATGFDNSGWSAMGAEILIQQWGGTLPYAGSGSDFVWGGSTGTTSFSSTASQVVATIPLSALGTYTNDITVGFTNIVSFAATDRLPAVGGFQAYAFDTKTWDGATWSDATPGATDDARIDDDYSVGSLTTANLTVNLGATLTVNSGETLTVNGDLLLEGKIIVKSGGSLITFDANEIIGRAITFERNTRYSDGKYSFVGSPVLQYPTIIGSDLGSSIYSYNEVTAFDADAGLSRWEDASASQMVPGVGYTQAFQQALSFVGTPNAGTITVTGLSHTVPSIGTTVEAQRGWNLVSNPYPAAIDVTKFIGDNANIAGSVYLWDDHGSTGGRGDDGDYLSANAIGVVSGPNGGAFNGYIGSSQGFFVQVMAETASTSIVFEEDQREAGSNDDLNFFRKSTKVEQVGIKLSLAGDFYNEMLLGFREDATLGYDRLYDAKKLVGNENIAFYSFLNDEKYAIQGLPALTESTSIPLGYNLKESGVYSLQIEEASNLPNNYDLIVIDTKSGKEYKLAVGEPIQLSLSAGADQNHLTLEMRKSSVLGLAVSMKAPFNVYSSGELLNIEWDVDGFDEADISIFDMSGSLIISLDNQVFIGKKWSSSIRLNENRIYIAHLSYGGQTVTKKFIK